MATVTIIVEGSTVGKVTVTETLDQAHSDRFFGYLAHAYGTDPEGNPRPPAGIIEAAWAGIRSGMFANVVSHEREVAAQAARDAVQAMQSETDVTAE